MYRDFIGPEARQRSQTDGRSVYELYTDYGITPEFSDKDPVARISAITSYLRPRDTARPFDVPSSRISAVETESGTVVAPRLYIFQNCTVPALPSDPLPGEEGYQCKIMEYLPQYRWRPQRTNFTEEEAAETPRKKDDHNIDCMGHILVAMDDLPIIDEERGPQETREERWVREHFDEAMQEAQSQQPALPWHPGRRDLVGSEV
jgi:hypothetical protein